MTSYQELSVSRRIFLIASLLWMMFLVGGAIFSGPAEYALSRSLEFGHDLYGRSVHLLIFGATKSFFLHTFPLLLGLWTLALFLSSYLPLASDFTRQSISSVFRLVQSFPAFLIALSLEAVFPRTEISVAVGIGVFPGLFWYFWGRAQQWPTLPLKLSTESLGSTHFHLWKKHLLPDLLQYGLPKFPYFCGQILMSEATLQFLGFGSVTERWSWGTMLSFSKDVLVEAPDFFLLTGISFLFTLWAFSALATLLDSRT